MLIFLIEGVSSAGQDIFFRSFWVEISYYYYLLLPF